jgi:hypothetical protein
MIEHDIRSCAAILGFSIPKTAEEHFADFRERI